MDGAESKRKAQRKEVSYDIRARFAGQPDQITIVVKDISATGARVIVPRLVKTGDEWEVSMAINGRKIECKAKIAWVLMLRPALGYISPFDVGIQFQEMSPEDRKFLEELTSQ